MRTSDIVLYVSIAHVFAYQVARKWEVVLAFAISFVLNEAVKRVVGKIRPDLSDNRSYYSGHTATAFLGFGILFMRESPYAAFAALSLGIAVAAGRVMERRHDVRDVCVGACGGAFLGAVIPTVIKAVL